MNKTMFEDNNVRIWNENNLYFIEVGGRLIPSISGGEFYLLLAMMSKMMLAEHGFFEPVVRGILTHERK